MEWLEEVFKDIHRHPELALKERRTSDLVKSFIDELGVEEIMLPGMDVGAACLIRGGHEGPTLALRADMDALPIEEKTGLEYSSEYPGVMHACGHDLNTAVLLGVMKHTVESGFSGRMKGNLKFLFQPGEEILIGARLMIEAGVLSNPDVDMILMSHGDPDLHVGQIGVFKEFSHATSDSFLIELQGAGGHAARPYETQDLVLAGSTLVTMLQSVVSRNLDARETAVLSVSTFNAGSAANVIPGIARLSGTVRTLSDKVRDRIRTRMLEFCDATAMAFGCKASLQYMMGTPSCIVDDKAENLIREAAIKHIPREGIFESCTRMGGEDFAHFSRLVPAGVMRLGVTPSGMEKSGSTHSSTFRVDIAALNIGVKILSQAVEDYLG